MSQTKPRKEERFAEVSRPCDYNPLLFGANRDEGLVAVEHTERRGAKDKMALFFRRGGETVSEMEPFKPFIVADARALERCPVPLEARALEGNGRLNTRADFQTWKDCLKGRSWLAGKTGFSPSAPAAPYLCFNDPVQQHLMTSGRTLFLGMEFGQLRRMQVDIECFTTAGYDFCNADRDDDRIIAIAMGDETGWIEALSGAEMDEKELLERFVKIVRDRDPDVIEGHNIFNFDLAYIEKRAKRCGVKLALGRNGSVPKRRPSRMTVGERTITYDRFDIFGRHIVDTLFLARAYDVSHRSLDSFGLKNIAVHFGFAASNRTYIEGSRISEEFKRHPRKVMKYVRDDIVETRELSNLLSRSNFAQVQMLPYSYQNVCVRGNATKIDALMIREYLRAGHSLPLPGLPKAFAGGYTDMFVEGIVENVRHCDVRSLYPSLMLTRKLAPRHDELGVFLRLLTELRDYRFQAKEQMKASESEAEKTHFDALQAAFKILINSFYGYLGFARARFSDFDAAETVTSAGRKLLKQMIRWLETRGARPIEMDTDGIYFVPPAKSAGDASLANFRREFSESLPEGIEIEFDGAYRSMYSYKMKNYALLAENGEVIIKGAALKSRGLAPFQRSFLREVIRLKLEGKPDRIPELTKRYEKAVKTRAWPIDKLAKTETLQDAPATYADKVSKKKRGRSAVYELALRSNRDYRAGDQVSYYVTGEKKNVAAHEYAKLVSEWDSANRDENVAYYLSKIESLCKKFVDVDRQGELELEA